MSTYYDRLKDREKDCGEPIKDLAKPLSATVQPRRARLGTFGGELTDAQAMGIQRRDMVVPRRRPSGGAL